MRSKAQIGDVVAQLAAKKQEIEDLEREKKALEKIAEMTVEDKQKRITGLVKDHARTMFDDIQEDVGEFDLSAVTDALKAAYGEWLTLGMGSEGEDEYEPDFINDDEDEDLSSTSGLTEEETEEESDESEDESSVDEEETTVEADQVDEEAQEKSNQHKVLSTPVNNHKINTPATPAVLGTGRSQPVTPKLPSEVPDKSVPPSERALTILAAKKGSGKRGASGEAGTGPPPTKKVKNTTKDSQAKQVRAAKKQKTKSVDLT